MSILLLLLVVALVAFVCFWLVNESGIPYPISMVIKVIIAALAIIALLTKSGLLAGTGLI